MHVCNAGFSCLVRFTNELSPRSGLGSFISSPRGSSVLSSLSAPHSRPPPPGLPPPLAARIGRACRQQRFPLPPSSPTSPRLASSRFASPRRHHRATISSRALSLSVIPFSFSISSGKIPPSPMFLFFSLFYRLGRFSLNVQTTSLGPGFYLLTLLRRSDNFQRIEDLI